MKKDAPIESKELNPVTALRRDYAGKPLHRTELSSDPIDQFHRWFQEAVNAGQPDTNAMSLATVNSECHPSVRIVLLKEVDQSGFVFFTNYSSRKGEDLCRNQAAALTFYWHTLSRQVRVEGRVEKVDRETSEEYFSSRPRRSRIAAYCSPQSQDLKSRDQLEELFHAAEAQFEGREIPLPDNWGGFRVIPTAIEFWQGREDRLHDRFRYLRSSAGDWTIRRLAP